MRLRNSKSGKPLINYNVTMILIPAMLMGTIVGQYLNQMSPSIVILLFMTLVMLFALSKIYKKAKSTKLEETAKKSGFGEDGKLINESELIKYGKKRRPTVEQIMSSTKNSIL